MGHVVKSLGILDFGTT